MKRRYVLIGLAVIAAVAIATPVFGLEQSIKKAIKKEVTKQVSSATGPAGATGASGAAGAAGSARAYGRIVPHGNVPCSPNCQVNEDTGNLTVTHLAQGQYCVQVPGVSAADVAAVVSVDFGETNNPEGNASAMTDTFCNTTGFAVNTERQPSTTVDQAGDAGDTMNVSVSGNAVPDDIVGFNIIIP